NWTSNTCSGAVSGSTCRSSPAPPGMWSGAKAFPTDRRHPPSRTRMLSRLAAPILGIPRPAKRVIVLAVDASLCVLTVWLAYYLRLGEGVKISGEGFWQPQWAVAGSLALALPIFIVNGFYRAIFRYSGLAALMTIIKAVAVYGLLYASIFTAVGLEG